MTFKVCWYLSFRRDANAGMLSNYEVRLLHTAHVITQCWPRVQICRWCLDIYYHPVYVTLCYFRVNCSVTVTFTLCRLWQIRLASSLELVEDINMCLAILCNRCFNFSQTSKRRGKRVVKNTAQASRIWTLSCMRSDDKQYFFTH